MLQQGRFEEAAEYHDKVAELLTEAHTRLGTSFVDVTNLELESKKLQSTVESIQSIAAVESLILQRDHHIKQAAVVR